MPRSPSIRDRLESDAWNQFPDTARRLAGSRRPERKRSLRWEDRVLLTLAAVLVLLLIVRVETARADSPEFFGVEFIGDDTGAQAVALDTEIHAELTGLLARIDVTQVFRNEGAEWAEAVYRFPLPEGAAVDRMLVAVGDRLLEGEIREKEEARRQYVKALTEGKVASLVEQQRANQFQTRLANIAAGAEIRVSISFLARVDYSDGRYSLQIPLTFTPRWNPGDRGLGRLHRFVSPGDSTGHGLSLDIDLVTGMELASVESRFHDIDIQPTASGYHLGLVDPDTRSDRVFELSWAPRFGATPEPTLLTHDDGDAVYALLMLAPPLAEAIEPQPREVVFIIDTSGSMEGTSIRQAQAALVEGLAYLEPDDRFNLVEFNSDARVLFDESVPAMPWYLEQAADFIAGLEANGGTNMQPALEQAMGLPVQDGLLRQIVFITDGSVGNERDLLLQIGERLGDARLFTVSIGSAPNAWFMRKAAAVGRGSHTHIGQLADVGGQMASLWARIENPAVQNLCVDWGMEAEFYPEVIPDLYAGEPLWLYARLPHEPRDVTVCGDFEGRYWEAEPRLVATAGGESIATMWARNKVESLEDSRIFGVDADFIRQQVVDLALEFGLLTRYTSLVAVDRTPVRATGESIQTTDVPSLLPAGSSMASGFAQTATGWQAQLGLSLLSLLVVLGMLFHAPPKRKERKNETEHPSRNPTGATP